jgi:uncharacterized protein YndB with AHSA1/START domain
MAEQHGVTLRRVFDAPRERVWEELTQPERFADWFGGPLEMHGVAMDVRPGGAWRGTMVRANGQATQWHGEYREVEEPERLVVTMCSEPDRVEVVTFLLRDIGDGRTELLFEQRGEMPPDAYERAGRGWGVFFDRIDERLTS